MKKTLVLDVKPDVYEVTKKIIENTNQNEPFLICDTGNLIWNVKNWQRLMPRVEIFYAMKCNDSQVVLETFATLGLGFDCASKEEIRKILALGVPPNKIVFSNPTKQVSHITYAKEVGVKAMIFDSEEELHKVRKHYPKSELLLRIRYDDEEANIILGKKYGALPDSEAWDLLNLSKLLGLDVIGVHFHVGSGSNNGKAYYNAIAEAKKVFDMGIKLGYQFKLLDIGGGYPGEQSKPINKIAKFINKALEDYFPDEDIKIIAEPGTYCCNASFKLATQINSKKIVKDRENQEIRMYYVDASVHSCLLSVSIQIYYKCRPVYLKNMTQVFPSVIWGATLDAKDRISEKYDYLPELKIGDWVIFEETGAYSLSLTCEYNGIFVPQLYSIIGNDDWLILTENLPKTLLEDRFTKSLKDFVKKEEETFSI